MKKSIIITLLISLGAFLVFSPLFLQLITYLHPIVIAVVLVCIFVLVYFLVLLVRKDSISLPYPLVLVLLIFYSIGLVTLLFFRPNDQSYNSINLIPLSTIAFYLTGKVSWLISLYNLAANIGLFIPYGIYLRLKVYSLWKLFVIPFIGITSIELLQFITRRGSLDIDDLILNLLGVFLGYLIYPLFLKVVKNPLKI